jgi:hypothetical protein
MIAPPKPMLTAGNNLDGIELTSPELVMLRNNKLHGYNYRFRKYNDWTENYEFYRDKVIYNRLTQRQSVNLPLMKKSIKTMLKYVDEMPILLFENLDNDKTAEIFKNEYWKYTVEQNKMEMQDIIDKKQVMLFGRSFDQWQVIDGKVVMTVQDPEDILVSRYTEPHNIHSSRFLIHTHIFVPLSTLDQHPGYDQDAVERLKIWHAGKLGLIKSTTNLNMLAMRQKKLTDMGVFDAHAPILGETYVELSLHFVFRDNATDENGKEIPTQIILYVEADNMQILMKKPLEEIMGTTSDHYFQNHYPYCSWADDIERQDFWSDSIADIIRQPNKVINSWYSQLVENRTMRNFNMHYFNSNLEGFQPQSYAPIPWGWYGIPVPQNQNINDVLQNVEIPELKNSKDDIEFITGMVNEATGASSLLQGTPLPGRVQLGVAQMTAQMSQERIKDMSKFYTQAWMDRGEMFIKLLEAAASKIDAVKVYKKGRNTNDIYARTIGPKDWKTKSGYRCKVWSQDDKNTKDNMSIQKLQMAKANMPMNPKLNEVMNRKLLEFAGLDAEEVKNILQTEMEVQQAMAQQAAMAAQTGQPPPKSAQSTPQPANPNQGTVNSLSV